MALPITVAEREIYLADWLRDAGSVLVGFSGGVDSAFLAVVAREVLGPERMLAVIGRSRSYPAEQWARARDVADRFSVPVLEVDTQELDDPRYAANPVNRCYFCKTELWHRLLPIARERGLAVVVDGTNADDLRDYRPGAGAAREQEVRTPLADLGFTKADIRAGAQRRGIPVWAAPASPCLSSRLPYGLVVTPERLAMVERAEAALRVLGIAGDLRVRHHGDVARVELPPARVDHWLQPANARRLRDAVLGAGFPRVTLDLAGFRSGSLNVLPGSDSYLSALAEALHALQLTATVESRDRMAILTPADASALQALVRQRAELLARASVLGVSHLAIECPNTL